MTALARQKDFEAAEASDLSVQVIGTTLPTRAVPKKEFVAAKAEPSKAPASRPATSFIRYSFALASLLAIAYGYVQSRQDVLTPKEGTGYWLGILGGSLLLAQLLYPLRKRLRVMRGIGSPPLWFRTHIILGVVAPVIILYHCNFALGATNSNVALFAMLIVATSGIVGRYFYGKIHSNLYGAQATVQDILADATILLGSIETDVGGASGAVAARLTRFSAYALRQRRSLIANIWLTILISFMVPVLRFRILSDLRQTVHRNAERLGWQRRDRNAHLLAARTHLDNFLAAIAKAAEFSMYERLFRLWHVLHMPLFCLLILTGIAHIVAVHLY
jgi:hypothetical protein